MDTMIDDFCEIKECEYKGEYYSVRDNGAVMRHPKDVNHPRPLDNIWTFGKKDESNGYMFIGRVRIHQIVATAFCEKPENENMIVNHKDANRCNNKVENLHWITKIENVFNNPITREKIEAICGSIENFVKDPSILGIYKNENPNFKWMCSVSPEEAKKSYYRWKSWANNIKQYESEVKESVCEPFYYEPSNHNIKYSTEEMGMKLMLENMNHKSVEREFKIEDDKLFNDINHSNLKDSLTNNALQLNWSIPSEFPNTPENVTNTPLDDYMKNLEEGIIFCKNDLYESVVYKYALNKDSSALIVLTKSDEIKKYALAKIKYENGKFIHGNEGSFFTEEGGLKYFTIAIGEEWDGGDVFDDLC